MIFVMDYINTFQILIYAIVLIILDLRPFYSLRIKDLVENTLSKKSSTSRLPSTTTCELLRISNRHNSYQLISLLTWCFRLSKYLKVAVSAKPQNSATSFHVSTDGKMRYSMNAVL